MRVELARRYSNRRTLLADLTRTWQELQRELVNPTADDTLTPRSVEHPASARRNRRRLTDADVQALLSQYENGTSSAALAKSFGIGKEGVLRLLAQHGVERRRRPMTEAQITEARSLYQSGLSVASVGQRIGVPPTTVQRALQRVGVVMRDRHDRPRTRK